MKRLGGRFGRSGGNYDGVSRGKSYDRGVGGYQNSLSHGGGSYDSNGPGSQNRELSRSMSNENWREAKSSHADDDHCGGGGASRGWGNDITRHFSALMLLVAQLTAFRLQKPATAIRKHSSFGTWPTWINSGKLG